MYLDNAATTYPKPDCVCDAVDFWMRNGAASAGRGSHRGTNEAGDLIERCRNRLARLLGVPSSSQIVFTLNCTDSLNTVLMGVLKTGDRVVASMLDHNSVLRPLQALAEQRNITFDLVHFDPISGLLGEQHFATLLADRPVRLVVLNHASNVTGRIQHVAKLTEMAHAAGAMVLLDAAQTAGHVPLNMAELNVDFLATAGHKGLLGPLGTGILCVRKDRASDLQPLRYGGTGTASESLLQPEEMPSRFESGNMNLPGIAGLDAAADWLLQQGVSSLHEKATRNVQILIDGLRRIDGVQLLTPHSSDSNKVDNSGIVSFRLQGQDCRDVAMILDQSFDIQCRAGLHCAPLAHRVLGTLDEGGAVRFSPGVFTTADELSQAIEAVTAIASHG